MGRYQGSTNDVQFSLEMPEHEQFRHDLHPWRSLSAATTVPTLVIDVCLRTSHLDDSYEVHARTPRGRQWLGDASAASIVLERWRVDLRVADEPPTERLPAVYKQAIVHFRTLYTLTRVLPSAAMCRRIFAANGMYAQLGVDVKIHTEAAPLRVPSKTWQFAPIATPMGALACSVDYCDMTELYIEPRLARLPRNARLPPVPASASLRQASPRWTPSAAPPPSQLGTSPLFQKMLSHHQSDARLWDTPRARPTTSISVSPSLSMHTWRRPRSATSDGVCTTGTATIPRGATTAAAASRTAAAVSSYEPGALRSLFSTTSRPTFSPSSLSSLRTPPGSFDAYMYRPSSSLTRQGDSPISEDGPRPARPQRIPRYSRLPSYRQREASRSVGASQDDNGAARSWSRRMEQRRQLDRTNSRDTQILSASSPGHSRVFAGPSPSPAFALPRLSASRTSLPPATTSDSPNTHDDLLDLMAMIETRGSSQGSPATTPSRPATNHDMSPTATTTTNPNVSKRHYYDDILSKMASSLRLQPLDEVMGTSTHHTPDDDEHAEDEAAGRLELSLGPIM